MARSKRDAPVKLDESLLRPKEPLWPTTMRLRDTKGRCVGTDNSVWLYRAVPTSAISEAKTTAEMLSGARPILAFAQELASITPARVGGRRTSKNSYRRVHILAVNIPVRFHPPTGKLEGFLAKNFPTALLQRRMLLIGVQLIPTLGTKKGTFGEQIVSAYNSIIDTFTSGVGTPMEDFDQDYERISSLMQRAGLVNPSDADMRLANSWFTLGGQADVVQMHHASHSHVFTDDVAVRAAANAGAEDCTNWPFIPGEHAITFASVSGFEYNDRTPDDPSVLWGDQLMYNGAQAISIRGLLEPPKVTGMELTSQRKKNIADLETRLKANKMTRADHEERLAAIEEIEARYQSGGGYPTLTDCSVLVALDGVVDDVEGFGRSTLTELSVMQYRQQAAMTEMMLCSPVRANPRVHDLPVDCIATAGLSSLSKVGDKEGALLGFTERDGQPGYLSPDAAANADGGVLAVVAGGTGSGKTMIAQWLSQNFVRLGVPVIFIDPKMGQDLSAPVIAAGGQVASLDDLVKADGIFDPLRFAIRPEAGIDMAASMLMMINPWGDMRSRYETPIVSALAYGVSRGARTIGQALYYAQKETDAPKEMIDRVFALLNSSTLFRACCGMDPNTESLRVHDGLTLIKVGDVNLELPDPGAPISEATQQQRISSALVQMMVFGSAMALTGRRGVLMLDEAWVVLQGGGRAAVERLGRLGRSQNILPMFFTQRVTDATKAELHGYISRGLILPLEDEREARAACDLLHIEPTPERISRITAKATMIATDNESGTAPNWNSMRALIDPNTRQVLRGTVAIYSDLAGRAIPVEIKIPTEWVKVFSTNPEDVRRRQEEERQRAAAASDEL